MYVVKVNNSQYLSRNATDNKPSFTYNIYDAKFCLYLDEARYYVNKFRDGNCHYINNTELITEVYIIDIKIMESKVE